MGAVSEIPYPAATGSLKDSAKIASQGFRREMDMSSSKAMPKLSEKQLQAEIKKEYAQVALDPNKGYHFHTGCNAANIIGYDQSLYAALPVEIVDSFAGTGNPFTLGSINQGDVVVDVGSGSGFDSLIASTMVGAEGKVVGIDMTAEMLNKARAGSEKMGAQNVEFREGLADNIPLPDEFANVVISNGVLNLSLDKVQTLREWARILKPGGRLYIGDIMIAQAMPQSALDDISLWTG